MVESPQAAEPIRNPERLTPKNSSALQMRMFMGEEAVQYPPVQIKDVVSERVKTEHERNQEDTIRRLGICAAFEGQEEWSKGEKGQLKHDEKVASWAKEVEGVFQKEGSKTHQQVLKDIKTLGGIDLSQVNQETARRLYDRYVRKQEGASPEQEAVSFGDKILYVPSNIKRFVNDIIAAHTENGVVNYARLQSHLPSLTFLAGMFGENTSQLLHDYLTASIRFTKDASSQKQFLQEVTSNNRINTLTSEEDTRLKWFHETSRRTKVVTPQPRPTPTPEPIVIKPKRELTQELARSDPENFRQSAFALLQEKYPLVYQVWDRLVKTGAIAEKDLEFDTTTWSGFSDNVNQKIRVGIQPSPQDMKYRIFEDRKLSYEDEIVYKLSHEICHYLVDQILKNKIDERVENLVGGFVAMREKDKTHGFSSIGSHPYYQGQGALHQAHEDIGELFNMYLQDPAYLRRFLDYISNPAHKEEIQKVGLVSISSDTARNAFTVVESVIQNYLKQKAPEPKKEFEIKIIEKPKNIDDLVKVINERADEPIIIIVDKPYEEKDVLDLRHAADRLNLRESLERSIKIDDDTEMTDLILLPGISNENEQFFYFNLAQADHRGEGKKYVSGLVMKDKTGRITPVGHVDYSLLKNQPQEAMACMSEMQAIIPNADRSKLPKYLPDFYRHFCGENNLDVAVRIDDQFKGKNLGKILWYLTLAHAGSEGIHNLHIGGDATRDIESVGDSFYKHLGAETILYASRALILDPKSWKFVESGDITIQEKLYSPTYLTGQQVDELQTVFSIPKKEIKKSKTPWDNLPKPDNPIKIRERKVIRNAEGKRTSESAEVHLIQGTKDCPLVVKEIWSDGRVNFTRPSHPERPYHIPAMIYFDSDITPEQKRIIQNTLREVFKEIGVPADMVLESGKSASEFFAKVGRTKDKPNQYNSGVVLGVVGSNSSQTEKPHHAIVFTNRDLYGEAGTNFVIGGALPDFGTVISLRRLWGSIPDVNLRNQVVATEIAHEVGHVYNLPSDRRGKQNINYSLGAHCKSPGCSMKQGLRVPVDWISFTQERLRLGGQFYCQECRRDLQEKFRK